MMSTAFTGCSKKETSSPDKVNIQAFSRTSSEHEAYFDNIVEAASYGLMDLRNDPAFVTIVRSMCQEKFDDEYNVLFKDLDRTCANQGINLAENMIATLERIEKPELIEYVDDAIAGFEYFDQVAFLHIYIPFFESVENDLTPIIIINKDQLDIAPAISNEFDYPILIEVDSVTASTEHDWVVSVNERVNSEGVPTGKRNTPPTAKTTYYEFDGTLWIDEIKYSSNKEVWVNGGPEISYVSYNSLGSGSQHMIDHFSAQPTGFVEHWVIANKLCESGLSKQVPNSTCYTLPDVFPNGSLTILYFERDAGYDRTENIVPGNPNTAVTFGSQEGSYGSVTLAVDANLPSHPIRTYNGIYGLDVRYGYTGGGTSNTFQLLRFQ